jgi:nicotinamidase-related amidase
MKKLLVVVDMQNDFIDGSLGSPEAQAIDAMHKASAHKRELPPKFTF